MATTRPSSAAGPRPSRVVRGYELLSVLGRGGMATVYLARQPELDRLVALKELGGLAVGEPPVARRFLREARVAGALSHPNIVTVHDYFEHEGTPYIAMEYVSGGTLRPHVEHMSLAETAGVLEGVLAGLEHAEGQGIVHRDLKPENLMVTADGRIKIADFGIAKATGALQATSVLTQTGTTIGTPTYMAPEQAMAAEVGPWTDLYSLGVIAFEMLVGRTPFYDSDTPMSIVMRHINEQIPAVSDLRPDVDPAVSDWVAHLLVKDPSARTQSAAAAWDEFEDIAIAMLGPRWRDFSAIGVPAPGVAGAVRPQTRTTRKLAHWTQQAAPTPRAALAATAVPRHAPRPPRTPAAASPPSEEKKRRRLPALIGLVAVMAIIAAGAAFAGGGGSGGAPADAPSAAAPESSVAAAAPPAAETPVEQTQAPAAPAPDPTTQDVLATLRRTAGAKEARLAAAGDQTRQARIAGQIATDYENAAGRLAGHAPAEVVAATNRIGAAYRAAAAAAARGDSSAFEAAGGEVAAARQALDDALAGRPTRSPPSSSGASSSSGAGSSSSSSGGGGGSGGPDENEPDENDNGD